jgi:cyclohexanone monooxygenase
MDMSTDRRAAGSPSPADVIVVGAGLAGLYAHHRLRASGLSIAGFEAGPEVGGTWFWNRYPGARCDVESLDYCYSFSPELLDEWVWSERYATQPEILRYINHVADRFDLRRDIVFDTRIVGAAFDEATNSWTVRTDRGDEVTAPFLIAATGCLSTPKPPEFDGLADFAGRWVLTSTWPREPVEMAGKRVAVIGTGSSGIQSIPLIAREAAHLTVFQRTPNFTLPARNGPVNPEFEASVRADYADYCRRNKDSRGAVQPKLATGVSALSLPADERRAAYEHAWGVGGSGIQAVFSDLLTNPQANATAAEFIHGKIREVVHDPDVAERLSPRDHPFATKRVCLDTDYFATFNRPNVELVDIRKTPIQRITRHGIRTGDKEYPVDLIVFATGFDAMTGSLTAMNIQGLGGLTLEAAWKAGCATYLGLMIAGFPNLFTVNGPGSPSVKVNMAPAIEHHVDWIADRIDDLRARGVARIEAEADAQAAWTDEVAAVAGRTLYPLANSWYMGANVPGKPRMFMAYVGGFNTYTARCDEVVREGYRGFRLSRAAGVAAAPRSRAGVEA